MKLVKSEVNGYYCKEDPGEPVWGTQRLSIGDLEARFISEFAHRKVVVEIGTGLGVATRALSKVATFVHTVDIDPWVKENIGELPENVMFHSSPDAIRDNIADMAFIDGCHETSHVIKDVGTCKRVVKEGGLFIFHDTNIKRVRQGIAKSGFLAYALNFELGIGIGWNDE